MQGGKSQSTLARFILLCWCQVSGNDIGELPADLNRIPTLVLSPARNEAMWLRHCVQVSVNVTRNPLVRLPDGLYAGNTPNPSSFGAVPSGYGSGLHVNEFRGCADRDIAHSIPVAVAPGLFLGAAEAPRLHPPKLTGRLVAYCPISWRARRLPQTARR